MFYQAKTEQYSVLVSTQCFIFSMYSWTCAY